jgi:glycosyltransferase involved in cell wall biosynthesis
MKILFISDFGLHHNSGGAQKSNDLIIKKGIELGHDIKLHNVDSSPIDLYEQYDLIISSNLEHIQKRNPEKIDFILASDNHVRLEHDSCLYLDADLRKKIFQHSKKNFFLSNFHIQFFREKYGDYFENVEIVYDPIDTNIFYQSDEDKEYDIVYCGFIHPLKGIDNLVNFSRINKDRQISVFGWADGNTDENLKELFKKYENITFHGKKDEKEIADILRKSKSVFHKPIVNEPFCRMIAEALICGVKELIGDPYKLGSYLEFKEHGYDNFKKNCENASNIFWSKIC